MKNMVKAILCLALVLSLVTGCTVVNVAKVGEVNGERIALSEYKYLLTFAELYFGAADYNNALTSVCMYDTYTRSYMYSDVSKLVSEAGSAEDGKSIWEKEIDGARVGDKLKDLVFDKAAELSLVASKAAELEVTLTDEETSAITAAKNSFIEGLGSKSKLEEALSSVKMTENELTDMWKNMVLSGKLSEKMTSEDALTDEALLKYYNDNYARVKHILIKVGDEGISDLDAAKAKADEVIAELDGGADFETLMTKYSGDVDSDGNINGGATGYVFKSGDFSNPAFEDASFALAVGEYTKEPVKVEASYSGYHIIKRYALEESYFTSDENGIKNAVKTAITESGYEDAMAKELESAEVTKSESKIKGVKLIDTAKNDTSSDNK